MAATKNDKCLYLVATARIITSTANQYLTCLYDPVTQSAKSPNLLINSLIPFALFPFP